MYVDKIKYKFYSRLVVFTLLWPLLLVAGHRVFGADTLRVHFIGNSYTYFNNLPHIVSLITDSLPVKLICTKSTAGGASLSDHVAGRRKLNTIDILRRNRYDIVILQDHSLRPLQHPDSMMIHGSMLCNMVKEKGSRVFLYNTWARKNTPGRQDSINLMYKWLAEKCIAGLLPAGELWAFAAKEEPHLELFDSDYSHPSPAGSLLNAMLFVRMLTGLMPQQLPRDFLYTDKDGETVRLIHLHDEEVSACKRVIEKYFLAKSDQ